MSEGKRVLKRFYPFYSSIFMAKWWPFGSSLVYIILLLCPNHIHLTSARDYLTPKKCGTPSPFRGLYPGWWTKMIIFPIHPQKNHGISCPHRGKVVTLKVMHHQCHHHHAKASPEVLALDPHCLVVDQGHRQEQNCSQTGPSEETNGKRKKLRKSLL